MTEQYTDKMTFKQRRYAVGDDDNNAQSTDNGQLTRGETQI